MYYSISKKIFCEYENNNKTLVSNGKSLVIKTKSSFYRYPLKKTPLNLILDKKFLIKKINNSEEKIIDNSYIIIESLKMIMKLMFFLITKHLI